MKKITLTLLLLFSALTILAQTTPERILAHGIKVMSAPTGIEANFTVNNSGYSGKGLIRTMANKYNVILPEVEVWYNGKDLFTANKNTNETTIVDPTQEELVESNPLAYITNAPAIYNVNYSTVKKDGKYVLELLPKKKGGDIKRITLTLNKANYYPEKIVVEPVSGPPISAEIISFKTGISLQPSDFEYPKSKFLKFEIVDLR